MCSMNDDPSTYQEPLEDSVDWAQLRLIRTRRETLATDQERLLGIPPRTGSHERWTDSERHSEARRGHV
jgi:hypothetical protein